mmetsp:Transcript_23277/g.40061  ORF Transcript_23277/g.40061 Transcript_23277/m.40061 type:complete len:223 (+) Transcript_23277:798-1466(+)
MPSTPTHPSFPETNTGPPPTRRWSPALICRPFFLHTHLSSRSTRCTPSRNSQTSPQRPNPCRCLARIGTADTLRMLLHRKALERCCVVTQVARNAGRRGRVMMAAVLAVILGVSSAGPFLPLPPPKAPFPPLPTRDCCLQAARLDKCAGCAATSLRSICRTRHTAQADCSAALPTPPLSHLLMPFSFVPACLTSSPIEDTPAHSPLSTSVSVAWRRATFPHA